MQLWDPNALQGEFEKISSLPGVGFLHGRSSDDARGNFRKVASLITGFDADLREVFWSVSHSGVVRGMHSGISGHQGDKLVTVQSGEILDVLIDLRPGPALGDIFVVVLNRNSPSVLVPAGVAHGFQVLGNTEATVLYVTSNSHIPEFDSGVNPLTCGINWPLTPTNVSERDQLLPELGQVIQEGGWPLIDANK